MTEPESTQNGQPPVSFDPEKPHRVVQFGVAQTMLQRWYKRNPQQFGYWLANALTDAEPSATARNLKGDG